ncbi:MAG: UDP-glucose 4-epimerase GalE [Lachnospiraceae bacterium]|nr:UDP-glucose 4-epimerase GalE [Lachnospiraceae bacterium]
MKTVLLTGGTGYIGSHTAVELLKVGMTVVIADNLFNSDAGVVDRIEWICGCRPTFYQADCCCADDMEKVFSAHTIDAVLHFAGLKAVGESIREPINYYRNNLDATLTLLEAMRRHGCKQLVFSSSATVYGIANQAPFTETMPAGGCTNPYGWTKCMIEQILTDVAAADEEISVVLLRYFNPIGAHESGLIGEKPSGIPNNLMPYITQVAAGVLEKLSVFGNDYPTHDGTGVRDYIHVVDLAQGHLAALEYALEHKGIEAVNLGTGTGYSVLDLVNTFMKVNGVEVAYEIAARRPGDIATCYADVEKAKGLLHWTTKKTLEDMCRDSWHWERTVRNLNEKK